MKRIKIAWSTEREVLVALTIVLLLVIILGVAAYRQVVVFATTLRTLDNSRQVSMVAEELYRHLLNAESGQRGYVITGNNSYLVPYNAGVVSVRENLLFLREVLASDPNYAELQRTLPGQIETKLAELSNTIDARREQGFEAAQSLVATDVGMTMMDDIRQQLRTLITDERQQFTYAQDFVVRRAQRVSALVAVLVVVVLGLAALVYIQVRRNVRRNETVREGLAVALRRERELNELKTHFIRTVSHEFRTPLAIIQTSTDLLSRYSDRMSEARREEHLDKLQAQVRHLTSMLEDAVTLQKTQLSDLPYEPAMIDLRVLCQQVLESMKPAAGNRQLNLTTKGNDYWLAVDPALMVRAMTNLLQNAIGYSYDGSAIEIELSRTADTATIRVRDQGTGIPYDEQGHLFDLFFRGSNSSEIAGAGLGLPVVKSIVELHAGSVGYASTPGSGTTFTITLPVRQIADIGAA